MILFGFYKYQKEVTKAPALGLNSLFVLELLESKGRLCKFGAVMLRALFAMRERISSKVKQASELSAHENLVGLAR